MDIVVNGQHEQVPAGTTLAALVDARGLSADRVAAELNGQIVPKAAYDHTVLAPGDALEIVSFVGGG